MRSKAAAIVQSGVIPYRWRKGRIEVALVTSRSGRGWTVPKGHIEPHLSPADSAAKEALEEAGLVGEVEGRMVGSYTYYKKHRQRQVIVFPLHVQGVLSHWDEMEERERRWCSTRVAADLVREASLGRCILRFSQRFVIQAAA